jgi:MarR family 2-MHQ and catechol resistance regulon transcriptional repressor
MAGSLAAVALDSQSPRSATAMEQGRPTKPDCRCAPDLDTPAVREWGEDDDRCLRLWISLARSYSTFARAVACKVTEYDLTVPQFGIMEALHHLGPLTLGELADKLLVTGGNITYVMDRLEEQGLVVRERMGTDRRVVRAHLTAEGRKRIESVFPGHRGFVCGLASHLDPEEQNQLRALLKKLGKGIADDCQER